MSILSVIFRLSDVRQFLSLYLYLSFSWPYNNYGTHSYTWTINIDVMVFLSSSIEHKVVYIFLLFSCMVVVILMEYIWVYECAKYAELFKDTNTGFWYTSVAAKQYMPFTMGLHDSRAMYSHMLEWLCQVPRVLSEENGLHEEEVSSENHMSENILDELKLKEFYLFISKISPFNCNVGETYLLSISNA